MFTVISSHLEHSLAIAFLLQQSAGMGETLDKERGYAKLLGRELKNTIPAVLRPQYSCIT